MATTEWNISTDIYDIVGTVDSLKARYIDDENETTLAVGIFGFIGDVESKKIQTSTIMAGELGNEMFPSRAKLTKNVLTHATYSDITNINAIPATITTNIGIRLDDLDNLMTSNRFVLDCESPIFIGEYEFHLDYDLIITRSKTKVSSDDLSTAYSYSAQYKLYNDKGEFEENRLSSITNQYLIQPFVVLLDNYYYLFLQVTLHQYTIEKTYDKIVTEAIIANKSYTFEFDNQLADFDVYLTTNGVRTRLRPFVWGSDEGDETNFCWYLYLSDNSIRVTFDNASEIPGLNTDLEIVAYTTLGDGGNFEYTKLDETSEGFYFTLSSLNYNYSNLNCFAVATTDSSNGKDRKSKEELQKLIPKAALSRGNLTTDTDVNNYFNLIDDDTNRLLLQKKVDNQLTRTWYAYFLLKDILGNIIPTNTIKVHIDLNSSYWVKSPDGRVIIPAGVGVIYDPSTQIGEIVGLEDIDDQIPSPSEPGFFGDKYYYMTLYNIVLDRDPLYVAFYITAINKDSYYKFVWVNDNENVLTQFVANKLHYERNLLTDQNTYHINFAIAQSLLNNYGLYIKDTEEITLDDGNTKVEEYTTVNIKCIMILFKDSAPYRWKECTLESFSDDGNYIYTFSLDLETDNGLDDKNYIKLNNLNVVGSSEDYNYGYFAPQTEARLYILAKFDSEIHDPIERGSGDLCIDNIAPFEGMENYVVTNIYDINDGITLYDNYTGLINSKVTALTNEGLQYYVTGLPVVGRQYLGLDQDTSEDNANFVLDAIAEKKEYIDYCLELLENNMDIDFKFFNTYGPSLVYKTEDDENIGHVDLIMNFEMKLKSSNNIYTKDEVTARIKEIMEDIYDVGDLHIPNLITTITNEFSELIEYIEFIGFNSFGPGVQHIIEGKNDDPHIPPEFLNIRNIYDENSASLVPAINIELV